MDDSTVNVGADVPGSPDRNERPDRTDVFTPEKRSQIMALVRSKNTAPERVVRGMLHRRGFRFRLHRKDLPGSPDIVLPRYRSVIFVNGCFWHQHARCRKGTLPKTNRIFWENKLAENVRRDSSNLRALDQLGWEVLTAWECEIKAVPHDVIDGLGAKLSGREAFLRGLNK